MRDFRFHDGETLPELRLHYRTVGAPTGEPVLILDGTADRANMTLMVLQSQPAAGSSRYIILPDAMAREKQTIGTKFPKYSYDDMVVAQSLSQHSVRHLRAMSVLMGGMWIWAQYQTSWTCSSDGVAADSVGAQLMMRRLI